MSRPLHRHPRPVFAGAGAVAACEASAADGRSGGIEIRVTEVSGMTIDFPWALL